jgi:SHS2 domain-containing protein
LKSRYNKKFELIEHTADIGIRAFGKNIERMFKNAALGMFSLITDNPKIQQQITLKIRISSDSLENLLGDWLSELLYLFETKRFIYKNSVLYINTKKNFLSATLKGENLNLKKHSLHTYIKAVTRHNLSVFKKNNLWVGEVIVDV